MFSVRRIFISKLVLELMHSLGLACGSRDSSWGTSIAIVSWRCLLRSLADGGQKSGRGVKGPVPFDASGELRG